VLCAAIAIAGCGARDESPTPAAALDSTAPQVSSALPEIRPASAEQVLEAVRKPGAGVVLVNVWATWCAPCREEFPELMRLYHRYEDRGMRLVLVSADFDDQLGPARQFLAQQGVDFPTFLKTGDDMRFINSLEPRWTGALPATLVYDGHGVLRHFWEGQASFEKFEQSVLDVIQSDQATKKESPS
jgi:thiol-disulfide isomerase/thioredoxin